jgi:UDP-N-acetylmuramate dehydrogenase
MQYDEINRLAAHFGADCRQNEPMSTRTTMAVGGPADRFVTPNSEACLIAMVNAARAQDIPFVIIGKGSNLLVRDGGYRGVIFCLSNLGDALGGISVREDHITAGAGAKLKQVCRAAKDHALAGMEFAYGIPGTVGGAVYMNAGAFGSEMKDVVCTCRYLDTDGNVKQAQNAELAFGYRQSRFTHSGCVILSADFHLAAGEKFRIDSRMNEILNERKAKQPLDYPSAGSTFKRPATDYASRLIDRCGLKGFTIGGAAVSEKHAGFVVNKGGATCADVLAVIEAVKSAVASQTGIALECEVEIIGE